MKQFTLDPKQMKTKKEAHRYLSYVLQFPPYYGENLDALHDMLSEISEPTTIVIPNVLQEDDYLGEYGVSLVQVFHDAEEENDNLTIK